MTIEHPPAEARHLPMLEITRGLSCAVVVLFHCFNALYKAKGIEITGWQERLMYLAAPTVDLFFVISGFIMVYVSHRDFGRPGATIDFAMRRGIRILPMYWLFTAGYALILLDRASERADPETLPLIASSFVFWPWWRPDGFPKVAPLLPQGWTLLFEVYFYALFTVFIAWGSLRSITRWLPVVFGISIAAASLLPPGGPRAMLSNPIVFDFWFGILLCQVHLSGWRPRRWQRRLLVVLAVAAMVAFSPIAHYSAYRPLMWGIPAVLLLAATLDLSGGSSRWTRAGIALGSLSYSLYLAHMLVVEPIAHSFRKGAYDMPIPLLAFVMFGLCVLGGALFYYAVERPLTRWLNRRWREVRERHSPPSLPRAATSTQQ